MCGRVGEAAMSGLDSADYLTDSLPSAKPSEPPTPFIFQLEKQLPWL